MKTINNIIEIELQIKLLEYLKEKKEVSDEMYSYVINKLIKKEEMYSRNTELT